MSRQSWQEIRKMASPQTLARAELKTQAMLDSPSGQDQPDPAEPASPP
jgi:hypothetical protein